MYAAPMLKPEIFNQSLRVMLLMMLSFEMFKTHFILVVDATRSTVANLNI